MSLRRLRLWGFSPVWVNFSMGWKDMTQAAPKLCNVRFLYDMGCLSGRAIFTEQNLYMKMSDASHLASGTCVMHAFTIS